MLNKAETTVTNMETAVFNNPTKTPHFESSVPEHGSVLAGPVINVVINFNFDLAKNSSISIKRSAQEFGQGELVLDSNKLSMRRAMDSGAPDGTYTVTYQACWPDKSCHQGSFQFAVTRSKQDDFKDQTNRKEITLDLLNSSFEPENIRISKGTKITWVNKDVVEHYINTDPHPGHNYYKDQNSKLLKTNESYSLVFTKSGLYPYHCSAHADYMTGNILVD
ncbi:MAG: hypothetical protein A3F33_03745 [Candidatus Woykebacteria bacterium RIFCSPHIGHO2_12_FULL_43_10]|uniref:Blue (type 1) copper domain-containing protein n=2 Tax=Candidatus Woykeibacteriota TaxID=1817899 RepID=A0A1G1WU77_9BACT|nr:MAG: hypothetical protein A2802_01215 [Candidatus Woykebacteria bacterium RIFCSPHIGHO2_01_FULL_43_29]OGY28987.1 MAG: hypothetical protein A3J50_03810 [Candidatus Woykebacteria bacterium RIFCSPHIGHO2_02_FULL_43_16b]OGY30354.1 MAG: hypothetical protein A3F33_03745 [Candidatus Woykebacteria bacterium RIFCSPHIGHO2_12_FULL_43_10]OGY31309.1 MAG: hypothetical protein A3A61_02870 [Candidatus Woykebacteria bacterium RIFCSPLOWO2_01_FULL_43_14]